MDEQPTTQASSHPGRQNCPHCHHKIPPIQSNDSIKFCPYCGSSLGEWSKSQGEVSTTFTANTPTATLVAGHLPHEDQVQFIIGPYQILHKIGQGGMGEVFLAYDTTCGRRIALKRIRTDLLVHQQMHRRFLKEARVTSQLTHPAIIPIYAIHDEEELVYYTMPYVEGKTLKQILRNARENQKSANKPDATEGSISSLIRIFLSICQAVGYAHSKNVLHRDLKPENAIVGKYGEVLILDWGLAKLIDRVKFHESDEDDEDLPVSERPHHPLHGLTRIGKVVGTISYMAPERALGTPATVQTEIYSLGVILYQILTLRHPFRRKNLKEYRQTMHLEPLHDPILVAPHRDIPQVLSQMALKCLAKDPFQRYQKVDELIHDLESYIEGRSEWLLFTELSTSRKEDWEFQENVFIAEHTAITRSAEISDWVNLMISKDSFGQTIKIEVDVKFGAKTQGIGFLLGVPEAAERIHLNDGYTLWIGSEHHRTTKLLRSTVEVLHAPDAVIKSDKWHHLRIEKTDRHILFFLDGQLQFSYLGLLPIVGTHIGILSRDSDFTMTPLKVFTGGQNITINCLSVPDAFLAHKDYATALNEYRRIGYSFPGRAEGREALFRAGLTLLEEATNAPEEEKETLLEQTFAEFEKLHGTPGAPFEYLGKALIYQSLNDPEEELKCYELALRRYPDHPLLEVLKEQILYRMHESSRYDRHSTYGFILLVVRYMPSVTETPSVQKLLRNLDKHWEPLFFIEKDSFDDAVLDVKNMTFAIQLAFWLNKPLILLEIFDQLAADSTLHALSLANIIFCLIELNDWKTAKVKLEGILLDIQYKEPLQIAIDIHQGIFANAGKTILEWNHYTFTKSQERTLLHVLRTALDEEKTYLVSSLANAINSKFLSPECKLYLNCYHIWAALLEKNWEKAAELFQEYSLEEISSEKNLLYFLYGCLLLAKEGEDIASIHFSGVLDAVHPRSWVLFSHFYNGEIVEGQGWYLKAFHWEKKELHRQAHLFYLCADNLPQANHHRTLHRLLTES